MQPRRGRSKYRFLKSKLCKLSHSEDGLISGVVCAIDANYSRVIDNIDEERWWMGLIVFWKNGDMDACVCVCCEKTLIIFVNCNLITVLSCKFTAL